MVALQDTTVAHADRILALQEAAAALRVCARTLAGILKTHPSNPSLHARAGHQNQVSATDLERMCEAAA